MLNLSKKQAWEMYGNGAAKNPAYQRAMERELQENDKDIFDEIDYRNYLYADEQYQQALNVMGYVHNIQKQM